MSFGSYQVICLCIFSSHQGDLQSKWGLKELRIKFKLALYIAALRGGKLVRLLVVGKPTHPGVLAVHFSEVAVEVVRVHFQQLLKVDIRPI